MIVRDIPNEAMIRNLCRKPVVKTPVKYDSKGRPSYNRHNTESTTSINPTNRNVSTIHALKKTDAKKYGIKRTHLKTETELRRERRSAPKTRRTMKRTSTTKSRAKSTTSRSKTRSSGRTRSRSKR